MQRLTVGRMGINMKYIICFILAILLVFALTQIGECQSIQKMHSSVIAKKAAAGVTAPAWADNALLAWDGKYDVGDTTTCWVDSADVATDTLHGAVTLTTFGVTNDTVYAILDNDDQIDWAIDSDNINFSRVDGITIYLLVNHRATTAGNYFFEAAGDGNNYIAIGSAANNNLYVSWTGDGTTDEQHFSNAVSDQVWEVLGASFLYGEAGNDIANTTDGGSSWSETDGDLVDWTVTESVVRIGTEIKYASQEVWIARVLILGGYQAAKPAGF